MDLKYDFAGNVVQQRESHQVSASRTDVLESENTYDDRGRLLSSTTRLNGGSPATVVYTYDAVGRLVSRKLGNTTETLAYNPRGWLTSKESTPFKMKLRYESPVGGGVACWNGNISEWEWQQGANVALMYGFTYDGVNRLKETTQQQKSGTTWSTLAGSYLERGLTYDRNGNLKTLQRTAGGTLVDNLVYTCTGNQLTSLTENVSSTLAGDVYSRGSVASGSYGYDLNGNLTNDSRRALDFGYNVLNLLSEVKTVGGELKAKYDYLADGTKLRVRDNGEVNGFDYLGSLTYRKSSAGLQLESASFGDGVIRPGASNGGQGEVNYFLTDHLGSVRVIVDGTGKVLERNDYYPFGARQVRSDYPQLAANRFKYNGKEEQVTGGLGYLDYGMRMGDLALGRWFSTDPLSENYLSQSPYHFSGNNPVVYVDQDGQALDWYTNKDETAWLWRDSKEKEVEIDGETYYNKGSTLSVNFGGLYLNYYQNILVSTSFGEVDVMESLLNNSVLLSKLLSEHSPLSEDNQLELLVNSMHKAHRDFVNHPVTQATIQSLLFVATGGIEGMVALGNIGKGLVGNIKVPIYRVFGGESRAIGNYWSPINPKIYGSLYRKFAGLPNVNTGAFTLKAATPLKNINFKTLKMAAPLDGNFGRLVPELKIFDKKNISIINFWVNF